MSFRVAEPTLGPEVANLLGSFLGCEVVQQGVLPGRKQFDLLLQIDGSKFVVELEIGGWQKLPAAIVQAEGYRESMAADGVIAIVYPEEARQEITKAEDVREIALSFRPSCMILCPFLKEVYPQISLAEIAQKLRESISRPAVAPSVSLLIEALRQSVRGISLEIRRSLGMDSPLFKETVGSLNLFKVLAQSDSESEALKPGGEETLKTTVADLASYILVNQLLLHRILANKLSFQKKLQIISTPIELNGYFKEVTDINYRAVFCVDVASNIPVSATAEVNIVIRAIQVLQPENLRHDLLGRIFHEFLPPDTRKQLGAFYTRPSAAEILAGLAINRADEKVLDPACGSGTLLVAAYRKKERVGKLRPHRKLVEEELTGVDIMPFAAHLAALNLTMQSPMEITNKTRIGCGNALFKTPGDEVESMAAWLREFGGDVVRVDGTEGATVKGESFKLEAVNVVIMNPPFTRKECLTPDMKSPLYSTLGEQNYWAYFVALAARFLKGNGRIAAVLPRDFFRGQYSRAVREFLFKDKTYGLRYIVKSTKNSAFSERAAFRDFLVVLQRGYKGKCALVYLKLGLSALSLVDAGYIAGVVKQVAEGEVFEDEQVSVVWRDQEEIWQSWNDLGHLVAFNTRAGERLLEFKQHFRNKIDKGVAQIGQLGHENAVEVIRGLEPKPEGLLNLMFIIRTLAPKRASHSKLTLVAEEPDKIVIVVRPWGSRFEIPKTATMGGLKTAAYLNKLEVSAVSDIAILKRFEDFDQLRHRLGIGTIDFSQFNESARGRISHLAISRRFNFSAPGTALLSFYSEVPLLLGKAFWCIKANSREIERVLCLWINSIVGITELLLRQSETEGSFIEITKEQLLQFPVPNFAVADMYLLLEAFEQVKDEKLPPLSEQFRNPPQARLTIDRAVLKFAGYKEGEIDDLLPQLYQALDEEMKSIVELMKGGRVSARKAADTQLHLLFQG